MTDPETYQFVSPNLADTRLTPISKLPVIKTQSEVFDNKSILLFNARPHSSGFKVAIVSEGKATPLKPVLLHILDGKTASLANLNRMYAEIYGCKSSDFFQWYACPLPDNLFKDRSKINAELQLACCDLVHSRNAQIPHLSDWRYFSAGKLCNTPISMDSRLSTSLSSSKLSKTLADIATNNKSQPQAFILQIPYAKPRKATKTVQTIAVSVQNFDPIFKSSDQQECLLIDKTRLKMAQKVAARIPISAISKDQQYLNVTLKGCGKATGRTNMLGVLITLTDTSLDRSVILTYCPAGICLSSTSKPFEIRGLVNLHSLGFTPNSVDIAFFPRDWPQYTLYGPDRFCGAFEVSNLHLQLNDPGLIQLELDKIL